MSINKEKLSRRDALKGLATLPVLGAFAYGWYKKRKIIFIKKIKY